ncbi:MAG: formimidoylglutamase [Balneola sp.]
MNFSSKLYHPSNLKNWTGRIDSRSDFDQFRYHQVAQCLDLNNISSKTKTVLLGFASDIGVHRNGGRGGAAKGPSHFRNSIGSLCWHGDKDGFIDGGNIIPENEDLETAHLELGKAVHHILETDNNPFVIGGGHETALGHFLGVASFLKQKNPKAKLGILNIDAHFDLRPYNGIPHSGSPFLQAHEHAEKVDLDLKYFVYGINQDNNTRSLFNKADELDTKFCLNTEIYNDENNSLVRVQKFIEERDLIYLTICLDVFEAAITPGVSAPAWNGLKLNHALNVIQLLKRSGKMISADICELNPEFDINNQTAKTAGSLFSAVLKP